ncbi:hypothetical protein NDU88_004617 [Pleurodeles waltl]|uniref:Uncharacterized protein n=1 Tax=Pleurodeles waltl TaxID=8319 RepID=A0AAV7T8N2_PLEWA|nr:hypothetical protein NDU88_004617 [Pleurodeles waltl]
MVVPPSAPPLSGSMVNAHSMRKDTFIKDMFTKTTGKKTDRTEKGSQDTEPCRGYTRRHLRCGRSCHTVIFTTLRYDIAALKQELAADLKDIRRNMGELEQSVNSLERAQDDLEEELEESRREILSVRDKTADLN